MKRSLPSPSRLVHNPDIGMKFLLKTLPVLVLLFCSEPLWAQDSFENEIVVDRVLAVVGAPGERGQEVRIITAYELDIEARLMVAERAQNADAASQTSLPQGLLDSVLETVIRQFLIEAEATRLQLVALTDEDLWAERERIEASLGGQGSLDRFTEVTGAPPDLVNAIVWRRAFVDSFIRQNFQMSSSVSDEEIESAYERGEHPFGDRPLEQIRPSLEAYLIAIRQQEQIETWLEEARGRNRVSFLPE